MLRVVYFRGAECCKIEQFSFYRDCSRFLANRPMVTDVSHWNPVKVIFRIGRSQ